MNAHPAGTVFTHQSRLALVIYCLIAILVIGDLDYITGYQTSILTVYILPIAFGAVEVGSGFAAFLAVLSVVISLLTDIWDGVPSSEMPMHLFNKAVALVVFFVSIALLQALKRSLTSRE